MQATKHQLTPERLLLLLNWRSTEKPFFFPTPLPEDVGRCLYWARRWPRRIRRAMMPNNSKLGRGSSTSASAEPEGGEGPTTQKWVVAQEAGADSPQMLHRSVPGCSVHSLGHPATKLSATKHARLLRVLGSSQLGSELICLVHNKHACPHASKHATKQHASKQHASQAYLYHARASICTKCKWSSSCSLSQAHVAFSSFVSATFFSSLSIWPR